MKLADVFNEKSKEYYRQENASEYAYITAGSTDPRLSALFSNKRTLSKNVSTSALTRTALESACPGRITVTRHTLFT